MLHDKHNSDPVVSNKNLIDHDILNTYIILQKFT